MHVSPGSYPLLFDARLLEESVLHAVSRENGLLGARVRNGRDGLYGQGDPEERERKFEEFHRGWFARMELDRPLRRVLDEHPALQRRTLRCIVMPAPTARDEGADLRDETPLALSEAEASGPERPTLILQLCPVTLVEESALCRLLDHELLHIEDMLDPDFGYRRTFTLSAKTPGRMRRALARYRVLWDCSIDGRLYGRGRVGEDVRTLRRSEFGAAFVELGSELQATFRGWFEGPRPTHEGMVEAACAGIDSTSSGICPLCGFPSAQMFNGLQLPDPALTSARQDFPHWQPEEGACRQCLDLYAAAAC